MRKLFVLFFSLRCLMGGSVGCSSLYCAFCALLLNVGLIVCLFGVVLFFGFCCACGSGTKVGIRLVFGW